MKTVTSLLGSNTIGLVSGLFTTVAAETSGKEFRVEGTEHAFDPSRSHYGACIRLDYGAGTIQVAVFGTEKSCGQIVRMLYGFGDDQEVAGSMIVDALGETLNLLAGRVKQAVFDACGQELLLGLPEFFGGEDVRKFTARAIPIRGIEIASAGLTETFEIVCADRSPENLVREILSYLDGSVPDKLVLTRVLGLWEELSEARRETASDTEIAQLRNCVDLVVSVINDDSTNPRESVQKLTERAQELLKSYEAAREAAAPPPPPAAADPIAVSFAEFVQIPMDEGSLEIIVEIVQEAITGLEEAEAILSSMEQGKHDAEQINRAFRIFHTIKGNASFWELKEIVAIAHASENLLSKLRDGTMAPSQPVVSALFRSTALIGELVERLQQALKADGKVMSLPGVGEQIGVLSKLLEMKDAAPAVGAAPAAAEAAHAPAQKAKETVRVDVATIDRLERAVASLALVEQALAAETRQLDDAPTKDAQAAARLAEIRAALEHACSEMRMVTLGPLLTKVARMVRDVSMKLEKAVRVVLGGEDTRIPRRVFEALSDPFVHLIRNALDHGVETQAERRQTSKNLLATIEIGGNRADDGTIYVHIRDDGRGLDATKLIKKALSKGLITEDLAEMMSSQDAFALIFAPGFSTAEQVTAMSGRGVGMDVVKQTIEGLGGRIEVESTLGKGCLFRMVIPPEKAPALTLAPEGGAGDGASEIVASDEISFL